MKPLILLVALALVGSIDHANTSPDLTLDVSTPTSIPEHTTATISYTAASTDPTWILTATMNELPGCTFTGLSVTQNPGHTSGTFTVTSETTPCRYILQLDATDNTLTPTARLYYAGYLQVGTTDNTLTLWIPLVAFAVLAIIGVQTGSIWFTMSGLIGALATLIPDFPITRTWSFYLAIIAACIAFILTSWQKLSKRLNQ